MTPRGKSRGKGREGARGGEGKRLGEEGESGEGGRTGGDVFTPRLPPPHSWVPPLLALRLLQSRGMGGGAGPGGCT